MDRKTKNQIREQKYRNKKDIFFNIHNPEVKKEDLVFVIDIGNSIYNTFIDNEKNNKDITSIDSWNKAAFGNKQGLERTWGDNPINQKLGLQSENENSVQESTKPTLQEDESLSKPLLTPLVQVGTYPTGNIGLAETKTPLLTKQTIIKDARKQWPQLLKLKEVKEVKQYAKVLKDSLKQTEEILALEWVKDTPHKKSSFIKQYKKDIKAIIQIFYKVNQFRGKIHSLLMDVEDKTLEEFFEPDPNDDEYHHFCNRWVFQYDHVLKFAFSAEEKRSYKGTYTTPYRVTPLIFTDTVKRLLYNNLEKCQKELNTYRLQKLYKAIKNNKENIEFMKYIEEPPNKEDIYKYYNLLNIMCNWLEIPRVEGLIFARPKLEEAYENKYISFITYILKDKGVTDIKEKLIIDPSKGFLLLSYYNFDAGHSIEKNYHRLIMVIARFLAYMKSSHSNEEALYNFGHKYLINKPILNKVYAIFGTSGKAIITNLLMERYGVKKPQVIALTEDFIPHLKQDFNEYCDRIIVNNTKQYCLYPTLNLWNILLGVDSVEEIPSKIKNKVLATIALLEKSPTPKVIAEVVYNISVDPLEGLLWICHKYCFAYYTREKNYHRLVNILAKCLEIATTTESLGLSLDNIRKYFKNKKVLNTGAIYKKLNELKSEVLSFMQYDPLLEAQFKQDRYVYNLLDIDEMLRILTIGQAKFKFNPLVRKEPFTNRDFILAWRIYCNKKIIDVDILEKMFAIQTSVQEVYHQNLLSRLFFDDNDKDDTYYNQLHDYNKKLLLMFLARILPANAIYCLIFDKSNGINLLLAYYAAKEGETTLNDLSIPRIVLEGVPRILAEITSFHSIYKRHHLRKLHSK